MIRHVIYCIIFFVYDFSCQYVFRLYQFNNPTPVGRTGASAPLFCCLPGIPVYAYCLPLIKLTVKFLIKFIGGRPCQTSSYRFGMRRIPHYF